MQAATKESREQCSKRGITQNLRRIFNQMDINKDGLLDRKDLTLYLKSLEYKPKKNEIDDMLWEIDENRDGVVNWTEFESAYQRCINDKIGNEPRQLHYVVLFALYAGQSKVLSSDAAAKFIYFDSGRDGLEEEFAATFGNTKNNTPHNTYSTISQESTTVDQYYSLTEFIRCMKERYIKQLLPKRKKTLRRN